MKVNKNPICHVCKTNESIGCASSVLGAFSVAFCDECLGQKAENKEDIEFTLWMCEGWKNTAEWVRDLKYYEDGKYYYATEIKYDKELINKYKKIMEGCK